MRVGWTLSTKTKSKKGRVVKLWEHEDEVWSSQNSAFVEQPSSKVRVHAENDT